MDCLDCLRRRRIIVAPASEAVQALTPSPRWCSLPPARSGIAWDGLAWEPTNNRESRHERLQESASTET
ncbi:hypothetical protein BDV19DRAFT_82166 [Aspergillus venezuelensis]